MLNEEKKAKKPKQNNSNSDEYIKISLSSIMEDEEEEEEKKSSNPSSSGVASSSGITSPPQSTQPTTHLNSPIHIQPQQQASTVVLSFKNYKKWTKKEVASLLRMKKREGGASLSVEKMNLLYSADFDGTSLDNIVQNIKRHDVDFAKYLFNSGKLGEDLCTMKILMEYLSQKLSLSSRRLNKVEMNRLSMVSWKKYLKMTRMLINELKLRNLSHVRHGLDRLIFKKLLNREQAEKAILDLSSAQYKASQQENITKQDLTFLIAKGGSGSGKTRIMSEVVKILSKAEPQHIFKNSSIIYFNFTNGFVLQNDVERDCSIISLISSRIIYAAFEQGERIAKQLPKITNDYFLNELLRIISSKLHEQFKIEQSIPIPLILAFDEYQTVTRFNQNLNTQLQHKIGWYMRNFQKKHGLILFPSFSGTLLESDTRFEPTGYQITTVPLPSL
ncbi:hypothetical protein FDP41_004744 [Naegleria fowleri]|uniref:Uncharacterized protein n=1 Tax=Naegleria fowleri TaxID=5763 RepID=A0A6A5BPE8_NAEFO|nr:uncharacterized protein FDP41_004744 [Naegleria fowleri]KAF0976068.1 hypothetical protein FDP41_004744 [Naegleria fowleri]